MRNTIEQKAPTMTIPTTGQKTTTAGKVALVVFGLAVIGWLIFIELTGGLDFTVYRTGAMTIFDNEGTHKELYSNDLFYFYNNRLPFTYPPFAALLFLPFAFMSLKVGIVIMHLVAIAAIWWMSLLMYDYANDRGYTIPGQHKLGRWGTIALIALIIMFSGPWRRGLPLVQINPLILLLVLADFLRPAMRVPRGVLIGIAGGIKLTPLAFGLILLMRKDYKGILTLAISFGATVGIGFLFLPGEAITFWTSAISDSSRVGNINFIDNISIQGWLMHLGVRDPFLKIGYYALVLVTIVLSAAIIYQLERRKLILSQVAIGGFLMVCISPISWSHHNSMLPLIALALVLDGFGLFISRLPSSVHRGAVILAWVGVIGLYISPMWLGGLLWGSLHHLEDIHRGGLLFSTVPIMCLYLVFLAWGAAALTPAVRTASDKQLLTGPEKE